MITFKQFLEEEERTIHAKKIKDAKPWSAKLAEGDYTVGDVTFSAANGLGAVPYNREVNYFGFVGMTKPSTFLELALPHDGQRELDAGNIQRLIEEGYACGIPFMQLRLNDEGLPRIKGHEGRARMIAIRKILGDQPIPVHFLLMNGLRSKNLTPDRLEAIRDGIESENGSKYVRHPFSRIYVNGEVA